MIEWSFIQMTSGEGLSLLIKEIINKQDPSNDATLYVKVLKQDPTHDATLLK